MRNLCPLLKDRSSSSHMALQCVRNHKHLIGSQWLSPVSYAKNGAFMGMDSFNSKWCSRASVALHGQVESIMLMSSPFSHIFMHGRWKFINFNPLVAVPCLMRVEHKAWEVWSKCKSMINSPSLSADEKQGWKLKQETTCNNTKRQHRQWQKWLYRIYLRGQGCDTVTWDVQLWWAPTWTVRTWLGQALRHL